MRRTNDETNGNCLVIVGRIELSHVNKTNTKWMVENIFIVVFSVVVVAAVVSAVCLLFLPRIQSKHVLLMTDYLVDDEKCFTCSGSREIVVKPRLIADIHEQSST